MARKAKQPPAPIPKEFKELWDGWLLYKKLQHKFTFADPSFEFISFQKLMRYSDARLDIAQEIIENAIAAGYKGFFPLKPHERKQQAISPEVAKSILSR